MTEPIPSAQAIAEQWYNETQIAMSVAGNFREEPHRRIPPDVGSQEFAKWLTHEYRLAMAKGIELERQRCWEPRYTIDQIVDGVTLEWEEFRSFPLAVRCQTGYGRYLVNSDNYWFPDSNDVRCDSIEAGQAACLADYRQRFRAELERAVGIGASD